jgi:hypothetical protein
MRNLHDDRLSWRSVRGHQRAASPAISISEELGARHVVVRRADDERERRAVELMSATGEQLQPRVSRRLNDPA